MTELEDMFHPIIAEVEGELKNVLKGIFTGPIVRSYLPQVWNFQTETENLFFMVDEKGNAGVMADAGIPSDVTIRVDSAFICEALKRRSKPSFEPKVLDIRFHTAKGETAFGYLRKRLGL